MTPTRLLIGQILIVFAIVVLGLWAATQWAASMLAYQPQLGRPWFILGCPGSKGSGAAERRSRGRPDHLAQSRCAADPDRAPRLAGASDHPQGSCPSAVERVSNAGH
jgi:hypothetical protein